MTFSPPIRRLRLPSASGATKETREVSQVISPAVGTASAGAVAPVTSTVNPPQTVRISENRADVTTVYSDTVRLLRWGASAAAGYTVIFKLLCPDIVNPFKGLNTSGRAGQRLHVVIKTSEGEVYSDQAILTYYGDDSRKGMTISLKLATVSGEHPFQGFADGDTEGSCFLLRAWLIMEDERFVERKPRSFADLTPTAQACIKCQDPNFQQFCIDAQETLARIAQFTPLPRNGLSNADYAKQTIYEFCGIGSRSILGRSGVEGVTARAKWKALMAIEESV